MTPGGRDFREIQSDSERDQRPEVARADWGSLIFAPPARRDFCPEGKCVKKDGHKGDHWPK